ncbi:MAG: murein hydrolase activator EnvC family protein [Acidiferrobacter sp.]
MNAGRLRKRPLTNLLGRLALALPILTTSWAAYAGPRHDLRLLRSREAALQQHLDQTLRERSKALDALRVSEDRVAHAERALLRAQAAVDRSRQKVQALAARETALRKAEARERHEIDRQARAAYATGRQGAAQILFSQKDPQFLARIMTYYGYILRARARRLAVLRHTTSALRSAMVADSAQTAKLRQRARVEAVQAQRFDTALARRTAAVGALNRRARSGRARLLALRLRAQRLRALVQGLRRLPKVAGPIPQMKGPFARYRGHLPMPIPARYQALRVERAPGGLGRWGGVLIPGRSGEPVRAVFPGRVVYANWLRGYGLLLILENGGGYMTLYGHDQALLKHVGDVVRAGEVIATVGDSGGFSRAGLYFDISHDGQPLNPLVWLAR